MLAPFYFKVGDSLANYIELNTNEVGALKPLEVPEDPDDLQASQDEQDEADKKSKDGEKAAGDDEPRIEEVKQTE